MKAGLLAAALLIGDALLCLAAPTQPPADSAAAGNPQLLAEQKHFFLCLAIVYDPAFWFSYNGGLYFAAKDQEQARRLEAMRDARARYTALTNRQARHDLAASVVAESGVGRVWSAKLLLPYSESSENLTPTLARTLRLLPRYLVVEAKPDGDALLTADGVTNFVMDFGRAAADAFHTNAILIKEGEKSFATVSGERQRVEAFTDAGLSRDEAAILTTLAVAFQRRAAGIRDFAAERRAAEDFQTYLARANDASPYMEYMLAKCYLEGNGTEQNRALGIDWMRRAARNGSGDAQSYLDKN